jgi:hypothetical protein
MANGSCQTLSNTAANALTELMMKPTTTPEFSLRGRHGMRDLSIRFWSHANKRACSF